MSEWKQATVQSIAKSLSIGPFGSRMKSDCYVASGVPVIRGNNISDTRELVGDMVYITPDKTNELRSSIIYADDLFFPHRGSIGQVGIVPRNGAERYILSSSLMKLTCDRNQVEPLFLFYFFRSDEGRHELLKNASTVGTPGIGQPLSTLKSIRVPVPPLSEQRAIASVLGTLDDKIELNRRMNETLEAMARALFQSWFVDATQAALPKGWRDGTLGDLVVLRVDRVEPRPEKDSLRYIALEDMPPKSIDVSSYQPGSAVNSSIIAFQKGDVLFGSMRPYFHKVGGLGILRWHHTHDDICSATEA